MLARSSSVLFLGRGYSMFEQFLIGAFADTRLLAHRFTPNAILAGLADTATLLR